MNLKNNMIYIAIILLKLSVLYASSFLPSNGQEINYTQIFFRWPQISQTNGYELKIFDEEENQELSSIYCESNSILVEDIFNWGSSYIWEVCGTDDYSNLCFEQNNFSINLLPEHHPNGIYITSYNQNYYQEGINILDFESIGYSLAINHSGDIVWFADKYIFFNSNIISGELLDNGNFTGFGTGRGYEFTVDSEIVFETPDNFNVHHQISKSSSNTYFILDAEIEYHPCPDECALEFSSFPIPWQGDRYIELNHLGEVIWEWNTFNEIDLSEYNPLYAETYNGVNELDWTHSNSILYDPITEAVYVSIRNLSRVTSINYATGEINWNLGNSAYMENPNFENEIGFSQQHSVQLTQNGNLIFFDNARFQDPELSRCVEITFDDNEEPYLVWEHILPDSMFTGSRGECDRLSNGNTLISAGRTGNVIEVNNNNEIIWHLRALDNLGNNISIYRTQRALNIFPNVFSFIVNNINGEYPSYSIANNQSIDISIFNQGWSQTNYFYELVDNDDEIFIDGEILSDSNIINYNIDVTDIELLYDTTYTLFLCTSNNLDNCQEINFQLEDSIIGDVNDDGEINIFDVVITVNYILLDEFNSDADLNEDEMINIQDIILLLSLILR